MTNMILCGCSGRMGEAVSKLVNERNDVQIVAGVDVNTQAQVSGFPIFQSISEFPGKADVIVDFSHHTTLPALVIRCVDLYPSCGLHHRSHRGGTLSYERSFQQGRRVFLGQYVHRYKSSYRAL